MSILSSTHTGHKYTKWQEDLQDYAQYVMNLSSIRKNGFCSCLYRVPVKRYKKDSIEEEVFLDERWFNFSASWPIERFISEFKQEALKEIKDSNFELEDVYIPKTCVIEDRV